MANIANCGNQVEIRVSTDNLMIVFYKLGGANEISCKSKDEKPKK